MNCHDALEQLESARPSSRDRYDSELRAASDHVAGCTRCSELFQSRESLDRRIGRVMRDVPIPDGLQLRILEAAGVTTEAASGRVRPKSIAGKDPAKRTSQSRRRWLHSMVAVSVIAAALLTGVVFLLTGDPPPETRLTLDTIRTDATLDVTQLRPFKGAFTPKPPGGLWRDRVQIDATAKGDLADKDGSHRVAAFAFTVRGRGRTHHGVIVAIPTKQLVDPPSATTINTRRSDVYARRPSGRSFHMFAWRSKDEAVTYVCFVEAGGDALEALQTALTPPSA